MAKQLTKRQKEAILRQLGTWADRAHKKTWEEIKDLNLTDEELTKLLGEKWGEFSGSGGPDIEPIGCKGGTNPRLWFSYGPIGKPDLQGVELLNQVRIILDMPRPPTDGQLSLF